MSERVDRIMKRGIKRVSDNPPQKALSIQPRNHEVDMEKAKSLSPALREDAMNFVERFYSGQIPTTEDLARSLIKKQEELEVKRRQDNL